ncbi:unnamed protein product [Linum tenue]|uniref:Uncharacterized protein n=1 Tax=Linum tenue TaxID=586396 RepID=A0AAV0MTJ2_9ROSI|nr:unnamed protein product [Linum tenue]
MQSSSCSSSSSSLQPLLSFPPNHKPLTFIEVSPAQGIFFNRAIRRKSCSSKSWVSVHAVEKKNSQQQEEEEQYEIDPDQAKQALQQLDQQLQQLSTKQVSPPKVKASEVKITREQMKEEFREIPVSVVPYVVVVLFAFSIFYNILFLTVIKPAIDGPELTPGATIRVEMEPSRYRIMQLMQPLNPEGFL